MFVDFQASPNAGPVHGNRLLGKDVLARGHRGLQVHGAEAGRRGQDDVINAAPEHLLISVEADEPAILGHIDLIGDIFLELLKAGIEPVLERVTHRDQLDVRRRVYDVLGGARPAAPAADEAHADQVTPGRVYGRYKTEL